MPRSSLIANHDLTRLKIGRKWWKMVPEWWFWVSLILASYGIVRLTEDIWKLVGRLIWTATGN